MSLPPPRPGLVIRYAFLWSHEALRGQREARKDRPAAIVVAARQTGGEVRVIVAPITHEPPQDAAASLPIPPADAAALGLDDGDHWIRLDELNGFVWPGFDLRPLPGGGHAYGMLREALYEAMRQGIIARQRARAARILDRDA